MSSPTETATAPGSRGRRTRKKEGAEARIVEPEAVEAQVEVEPEAEVVAVVGGPVAGDRLRRRGGVATTDLQPEELEDVAPALIASTADR